MPIVIDANTAIDGDATVLFGGEGRVSTRYGLTVYDAAYLELAIRLGTPIATNDAALVAAARSASVTLVGR